MDSFDSSAVLTNDNFQMSIIEDSIQDSMAKNKETLKRRLETRRSLQHLVEQGIMPPPSVPPHFFEQSKHLQMAKTQDILKRKIIRRPDKKVLIDHHILPDSKAAPLLQMQQQRLKKAKLADNLNDKLANRPGPLELVEHNILETDPSVKEAIKGGLIQYRRTSSVPHPFERLSPYVMDEDVASSPESTYLLAESDSSSTSVFNTDTSYLNLAGTASESKNKSKPTKTRVWKRNKHKNNKSKHGLIFHEYKGPSHKSEVSKSPEDKNGILDSYKILLQQQQLFLQLVQTQHLVLPTPDGLAFVVGQSPSLSVLPVTPSNPTTITTLNSLPHYSMPSILNPVSCSNAAELSEVSNLQNLKVLDLKTECRRRKLGISGTKQQLIDRIKGQLDVEAFGSMTDEMPVELDDYSSTCFQSLADTNAELTTTDKNKASNAKQNQASSVSSVNLLLSNSVLCPEELLLEQDKKIDELDKQLEHHKSQLKDGKLCSHNFGEVKPKCDPILSVQLQKRILEQHRSRLQAILANHGSLKKRNGSANKLNFTEKCSYIEHSTPVDQSTKKCDERSLQVANSVPNISQQTNFEEITNFRSSPCLNSPSMSLSFDSYGAFENAVTQSTMNINAQSSSQAQESSKSNCPVISNDSSRIQDLMNYGSMNRNDTIDEIISMLSAQQTVSKDSEDADIRPEINANSSLPSFNSLLPLTNQSLPSFNLIKCNNQGPLNNNDINLELDMSMDWIGCDESNSFADSYHQPPSQTNGGASDEKRFNDMNAVFELCNNELDKDCFDSLLEDLKLPENLSWTDNNYLELSNPPSPMT